MASLEPRINAVTNTLKTGQTYYFTGSEDIVPYLRQAEYTGWQKTGPYRMVGRTVNEFEMQFLLAYAKVVK